MPASWPAHVGGRRFVPFARRNAAKPAASPAASSRGRSRRPGRRFDVRVRVDVAALLRVDGLADDVVQERAAALGHVQEVHPRRRRSQREPDEEAVLHIGGAAARAQRGDVFLAARALLGDVISFSRAIAPWVSQGWLLAVAGLRPSSRRRGCSTEFKLDAIWGRLIN